MVSSLGALGAGIPEDVWVNGLHCPAHRYPHSQQGAFLEFFASSFEDVASFNDITPANVLQNIKNILYGGR